MMHTVAALALAASMARGPTVHDLVTVERVSAKPCCGSGVVAFFVDLTVRTRKNERLVLSVYYMGPEQPFPQVGDVCGVGYSRHPDEMFANRTARLVVSEMHCRKPGGNIWQTY